MNGSVPPAAPPPAPAEHGNGQRRRRERLDSHLDFALTGVPEDQESTAFRCSRSSPELRSLFMPTATVQRPEAPPDAQVLLRTSSDQRNRLLCVYNLGDRPLSFAPAHFLGTAYHTLGELRFVSGDATSSGGGQDSITFHLAPLSYVWLGLFGAVRS